MAVIFTSGEFSFLGRFNVSEAFSKRMFKYNFYIFIYEKSPKFEEESSKIIKWDSLVF